MADPDERSDRKIYLHTSDLNTKFLNVFVASRNPRTIQVKRCRALYNGKLVGDIMVHADFVQRDYYLDHFICLTNAEDSQKYIAKYNFVGTTPDFNVWFTDIAGNSSTNALYYRYCLPSKVRGKIKNGTLSYFYAVVVSVDVVRAS